MTSRILPFKVTRRYWEPTRIDRLQNTKYFNGKPVSMGIDKIAVCFENSTR